MKIYISGFEQYCAYPEKPGELTEWMKLLQEIKPSQVMIYTIDRDTPATGLEKVKLEVLEIIADRVRAIGFEVQVSG